MKYFLCAKPCKNKCDDFHKRSPANHASTEKENMKPALCGDKYVMTTQVPFKAWGMRSHIREVWCKECEKKIKEKFPDWKPSTIVQ